MTMSTSLSLEPCPFHLKWKKQFSFPRTHTLTTSISIPNNIKSHKFKCHLNQNHKTPSSITSNSKPKSLLESLATTVRNTLRKPSLTALLVRLLIVGMPFYHPKNKFLAAAYDLLWFFAGCVTCCCPFFSYYDDEGVLTAAGTTTCDEGSVLTAAGITTVLKLQVGLLGMGRSLQRDLNRIAEVADTSSSEGLKYILTETSLALLRHPDYCISGYSSVDIKRGREEGEKRFNQLSIEERGKFDEETLVNVNNIKRQNTRSQRSNGFSNEYIVVTILAAAEGEHKLPSINESGNLKEALQKLGSIPSRKLLAVEVLWTPQNENDTLSELEFLEYYPLLLPL